MADIYPWQQALWSQLGGRAQHAHAYLLYGPAGIGKRALAEHWAAQLLCQRPAAAGACGECKACQLLAAGTHPDYFVLEPEEAEKPIRVDQVRDLVGFVVQTAQLGGRKVVLLEPAEAMNVNAANALLKSLEEPSGDTVLLLISHQPSRLLPTIKSRCVQQACPLPGAAASLEWLARALPDEPAEALEELLALSGGSPLTAQRLYGQGVREQRAQVVEGEEAAQTADRRQPTGRKLEQRAVAIAVRLVLRLDAGHPALPVDPRRRGAGVGRHAQGDPVPGRQVRAGQGAGHAGLAVATAAESVEQGQPQPCPASRSPAGAVGKPARAGLESR